MIYDQPPKNWKDLQKLIYQVYKEMDCDVYIEKDVQTIRGITNIDVYVRDVQQSPPLVYLCECKNWNRLIPKGIVYAFRTLVSDIGAHCGFIISKKGFQSGAYEVAKNSNIFLLTWEKFQEVYEERWTSAMCSRLEKDLQTLARYATTPRKWTDDLLFQFKSLQTRFMLLLSLGLHAREKVLGPYLITTIHPDDASTKPDEIMWIKIHSKREFFDLLLPRAKYWITQVEQLLGPL